jgi:PEGA domain
MHIAGQKTRGWWWVLVMVAILCCVPALYAGNEVMGELQFEGKSKVERTSGVWIDGGYVGYLKELKGSKKVLLLPGEHLIMVRQDGYEDFTERTLIQPGEKKVVLVTMNRAATGAMPRVKSTVKLAVNPTRAAVFVDGLFVGHVGEFEGAGRGMLIAPGPHKIRIALPGYQTFETTISPLPNQKVEVKTDLIKDNAEVRDPMLKMGATSAYAPPAPPPAPDPRGPQ